MMIAKETILLMSFLAASASAPAATYNATVVKLYGYYDSSDCIYFQLNGVSDTFTILRTNHAGAKEAFAMLLAAKLTGTAVYVSTRGLGEGSCGGVAVAEIVLQ